MSDRLKQSLMASRTEIEAGLDEAELARARQRARELEELIALGTARQTVAAPAATGNPPAAADLAAAHEKSKDELQSRLSKARK